MPLPSRKPKESKKDFISRCMSDEKTKEEFPSQSQRVAICMSKANNLLNEIDECYSSNMYGYEEDLTADNYVEVSAEEYIDFGEDFEEIDLSIAKPGLWENIRKKKEREGKKYKPAKPGDPDRPSKEAWKQAQSAEYQGRKVTLNKPFRTPDGPKKFSVYVKNDKGNIVKVNFGDPNMKIKKNIPERRKSFRARHRCDQQKDKTTPAYWSCKMW